MIPYLVIATWPFGEIAARAAVSMLDNGCSALDAAVAGAQAVEDDPQVHSVGYGGLANAVGTVQLDACVMEGKNLNCGGVAGLENVRHPTAVARKVMEKTPHLLLVGEGARVFAIQQGFPLETLHTPESLALWEKRRPSRQGSNRATSNEDPKKPPLSHDTVTILALDRKGSLAGACSTSGLAHKLPGRVGDSPLIGSGLYVDNFVGAAGATGVGEEITRAGGSLLVLEALRSGKTPQEACEFAVSKVNSLAIRRGVHSAQVAFLAMDAKGRFGACCTTGTHFEFAVGTAKKIEMLKAPSSGAEEK